MLSDAMETNTRLTGLPGSASDSRESQQQETEPRRQASFSGRSASVRALEQQACISASTSIYDQRPEQQELSFSQHGPIDQPQVDPFQALATYRTTTFGELSRLQLYTGFSFLGDFDEDAAEEQEEADTTGQIEPPIPDSLFSREIFEETYEDNPQDNQSLRALQVKLSSAALEPPPTLPLILPPALSIERPVVAEQQPALSEPVAQPLRMSYRRRTKTPSPVPKKKGKPPPMRRISKLPHTDKIIFVESAERPYQCGFENCDATYKQCSHLRAHFIKHTSSSKYQCSYEDCGHYFRSKKDLKRHMDTNVHEKKLQCKFCNQKFMRQFQLTRHMVEGHFPVCSDKSPAQP